jgi:hypothetical protein
MPHVRRAARLLDRDRNLRSGRGVSAFIVYSLLVQRTPVGRWPRAARQQAQSARQLGIAC